MKYDRGARSYCHGNYGAAACTNGRLKDGVLEAGEPRMWCALCRNPSNHRCLQCANAEAPEEGLQAVETSRAEMEGLGARPESGAASASTAGARGGGGPSGGGGTGGGGSGWAADDRDRRLSGLPTLPAEAMEEAMEVDQRMGVENERRRGSLRRVAAANAGLHATAAAAIATSAAPSPAAKVPPSLQRGADRLTLLAADEPMAVRVAAKLLDSLSDAIDIDVYRIDHEAASRRLALGV